MSSTCAESRAKTAEDLALLLEKRKALLVGAGKRIIGEKLVSADHPEYKSGVDTR